MKPEDSLIFVRISQGEYGFLLITCRHSDTSPPALVAAESQAKSDSLANLFEQSELFAIFIWPETKGPQRGRDRAEVVLGPFAETKGPRLPGRNPASQKTP